MVKRRHFMGLLMGATSCGRTSTGGHDVGVEPPPTAEAKPRGPAPEDYAALLRSIEAERDAARGLSLDGAREVVRGAIIDRLLPAWQGTRWSFHGTATRPHASEGIACGYFVATILQHAGLRLTSRSRFGQAPALDIQRALTPKPDDLHRIFSVPATEVERRIVELGPGLYVIGLNVHVGFVVVRERAARFVHASYTGRRVVTDEPLGEAKAIHASRKAGYFVTPLFHDQRLVMAWLHGKSVAAPA